MAPWFGWFVVIVLLFLILVVFLVMGRELLFLTLDLLLYCDLLVCLSVEIRGAV